MVIRVNLGWVKQLARERKRSAASCQPLNNFFKKRKESESHDSIVAVTLDSTATEPGRSRESADTTLISPNQANETSGNCII